MDRAKRREIAEETVEILQAGLYINTDGEEVSITDSLNRAIANTIVYKHACNINGSFNQEYEGKIEVTPETTLEAVERLVVDEGLNDVVCLNFASAKNPGGGFLNGSQAQEESLARSSGLYACLLQKGKEMYDYNRRLNTGLYSDYMIYSPNVPVFRNDNGILLDKIYEVSMITAPSVNAGVIKERERHNTDKISKVMIERIRKILNVAIENNNRTIVLGAFGCGVFKNNPLSVADYFRKLLTEEGLRKQFNRAVFAV